MLQELLTGMIASLVTPSTKIKHNKVGERKAGKYTYVSPCSAQGGEQTLRCVFPIFQGWKDLLLSQDLPSITEQDTLIMKIFVGSAEFAQVSAIIKRQQNYRVGQKEASWKLEIHALPRTEIEWRICCRRINWNERFIYVFSNGAYSS